MNKKESKLIKLHDVWCKKYIRNKVFIVYSYICFVD